MNANIQKYFYIFKRYQANSWIMYEKMVDQIPFDDIMKSKITFIIF